jgi:hypothetical protein
MKLIYSAVVILILGTIVVPQSYATSGTVILAKGVVIAMGSNSVNRILAKGAPIGEGDVINTSKRSFAVIRMIDNTKLTLKPETTVAIGTFSLEKGKEEACINLVKGGLRTVTGLIGKRRPEGFQVDTPIASIGIRGTDFITRICAGDECSNSEQELSYAEESGSRQRAEATDLAESINEQLPEGIYGSCETGSITMSQCAGQAQDFEVGKCRVSQQTDCTQVELGAGKAGYAGLAAAIIGGAGDAGSFAKTSAEKGGAEKGGAEKGGAEKGGAEKGGAEKGGAEKGGAEKGSAETGSAETGSAETGTAAKGDSKSAASKPANGGVKALARVPLILDKDPHFALSDLTDAQLDSVDPFTSKASSTGECSN